MTDRLDNSQPGLFRHVMLRVPVPSAFVLACLCGVGLEYALATTLIGDAPRAVSVVGGGLFVAGAALAGWGWLTFRRARTTTVPGQYSSRLVTWGPYRFSRNPMYVGLI